MAPSCLHRRTGEGLWRVTNDGVEAQPLTTVDRAKGELQHAYPQRLPDGTSVLFTIVTAGGSYPAVLSLETRKWQTLKQVHFASGGGVVYTPSGHLLYPEAGGLFAVPYDSARGALSGTVFALREQVESGPTAGTRLTVSARSGGTLVYVPGLADSTSGLLTLGGSARPHVAPQRRGGRVFPAAILARRPARRCHHSARRR